MGFFFLSVENNIDSCLNIFFENYIILFDHQNIVTHHQNFIYIIYASYKHIYSTLLFNGYFMVFKKINF